MIGAVGSEVRGREYLKEMAIVLADIKRLKKV
jgi:hypothetical protein